MSTGMKWFELEIEVDPEGAEAVSEVFARYGYNQGVAVQQNVRCTGEEGQYVVETAKPVVVRTYLPAGKDAKGKIKAIERELWFLNAIRPLGDLRVRRRTDEEWAETWKEFFPVLHLGRRLVIKPSWLEYSPQPDELIIELDPGMAFGTGLHPSTRMVLELLEETIQPGQEVLDVGTGSGILALAAVKLGARRVLAMDTDPVAVKVAKGNVKNNEAGSIITVQQGSAGTVPEGSGSPPAFDLVLSNIVANVIIDLAPDFHKLLRSGGHIIASGIIAHRLDDVLAALRAAGLELATERREDDWVALVAWKP